MQLVARVTCNDRQAVRKDGYRLVQPDEYPIHFATGNHSSFWPPIRAPFNAARRPGGLSFLLISILAA